jgi:hypothetical protein
MYPKQAQGPRTSFFAAHHKHSPLFHIFGTVFVTGLIFATVASLSILPQTLHSKLVLTVNSQRTLLSSACLTAGNKGPVQFF